MDQFDINETLKSVYDDQARNIILSVMEGRLDPLSASSPLTAFWKPNEDPDAKDAFILGYRHDSLNTLDHLVIELMNHHKLVEARRLAELNIIVAKRLQNHILEVQCAFTLSQVLTGDPTADEHQLELLEFSVPEILKWDRPPQTKYQVLFLLAEARLMAIDGTRASQKAVIQACEQAWAFADQIEPSLLGKLYFVEAVAYGELRDDQADVKASIRYYEKALQFYSPEESPKAYINILTGIGRDYRILGQLQEDPSLVRKAMDYFDNAFAYHPDQEDSDIILQNQLMAKELLLMFEKDNAPEPAQGGPTAVGRFDHSPTNRYESRNCLLAIAELKQNVKRFLDNGDHDFYIAQNTTETEQAELYSQGAAKDYLKAMRLLGQDAPPELRAEVYHRIALLYISASEDDPVWIGVCFTNATRRLGAEVWKSVSLRRATYHQGRMLVTIGYPNQIEYLNAAASLLAESLPELKENGRPGEYNDANSYYKIANMLLQKAQDDKR